MNVALAIGRAGSTGLPGKHFFQVAGRPLMAYPMMAAQNARLIDRTYVSTDSPEIAAEAAKYGAIHIQRPPELATNSALTEDVFRHGYEFICNHIGEEPETVTLLFCNGATITPGIIDEGIEILRKDPSLDSSVTVSKYNMWSPLRSATIGDDGLLVPFTRTMEFDGGNCDRDSQGDVYFCDCSVFVVRPRCFDYDKLGEQPFRWVGRRVFPMKQTAGLDVDFEYQLGQVEYWLRQHGFSETTTPYSAAV